MTTTPKPALRALAEAAEGNGEHIYTNPRDSNKWRENEAWHRAASPGAVLHLLDRIHDLERKVGRIQGLPLPLIDALNAATGSHDWQGEAGPDALAEPACKAIAALQAERDEADRRAGAAERSAAAFHEDNQRFEQVRRRMKAQWGVHNNVSFDVVWQQALDAKQALAELEARKNARIHELEMQALDLASENSILKLQEQEELEARKPLPPDALADKCEAWLQAGGASNIVDAFEAGYRAAERAEEGKRK